MKLSATPRLSISGVESIMGLMACISLLLILMPKTWLVRHLDINPFEMPAILLTDAYQNGNSENKWINERNRHWQCELKNQYKNPYCNLQLNFRDSQGNGFDLSRFDTMKIDFTYTGDGETVRLYLRNSDPAYTIAGNDSTTKYNSVEIPIEELSRSITINLKDFGVADWWLASQKISMDNSHADFNNIVLFEIQTGSGSTSGLHEFELRDITFEGSFFSDVTLYKAIAVVWSLFIFSVLLYRMIRLKIELDRNRRYQDELVSINNLLNLQNKHFEDLAKTDQLTGLLNRIGIREALYEGLNDWKARRKPFSMVLVDIDHFKNVNDTFGHDVGDEILKGVAKLMKSHVRHTDFLARWGGEEFILVCPDTDLGGAHRMAELLRAKLEAEKIHPDIAVTASFGVASLNHESLDLLFKSADEALYDAKHQGRNRVAIKS